MMKKYFLLFLTLLPLAYLFFFMWVVMASVVNTIQTGTEPSLGWFLPIVMILHPLAILLLIGLMIYYIYHLYQKTVMPPDQRVLWLLLIIFTSMIGMTVYWFMFIQKEGTTHLNKPTSKKS